MISTELLSHFGVLRDPSGAITDERGPVTAPRASVARLTRPGGPARHFGLDITHPLRVLALEEVSAWLIPGSAGICVIMWQRSTSTASAMSGPIEDAILGTFVSRASSMGPDRVANYRAVGLAADGVVEITHATASGSVEPIPVRNNVWTIADQPADGVVTLRWQNRATERVPVGPREPPRR